MPVASCLATSERLSFSQAAPQGFGDRHNSWTWSMLWSKDKLYVGTNRAWHCAERAAVHARFPLFAKYPLEDPDAECASDYRDLPFQAEIWCWTPETDHWERVYQSPQDVPIPNRPGKYVAREVGYRDMAIFVEPDGTEVMYVSGVNLKFIYHRMPPPRLLRSTDGLTFEAIPQAPGTFLGELDTCAFRTIAAYKERLFVITGTVQGHGVLLESSNPAAGNDHYRQVSPTDMGVFEMIPFNGYLYLGLRDVERGYAVLKTDATGAPPYTFTPVVTDGAFLPQPSRGVISMHVYKGRLYVGTDRPAAEVIRINPDDTWDLVVGTPRETPDGWKYPLSGLDAGFNNWLNGHIWRMQEYDGRLYLGTMNMSTHLREIPGVGPILQPNYGFGLYETADEWHYAPITLTGFDDKFNWGARSFAKTPYGLFLGTTNNWYGLQIWRGSSKGSTSSSSAPDKTVSIATSGQARPQELRSPAQNLKGAVSNCPPPERLEVEYHRNKVVLSWECPIGARLFRVWRSRITDERHVVETHSFIKRLLRIVRAILPGLRDVYLPPLPAELWIPGAYAQIGTTEQFYFEDTTPAAGERYLYYVHAEGQSGDLSEPSNIVAVPFLMPPVTFESLLKTLDSSLNRRKSGSAEKVSAIHLNLEEAHTRLKSGDVAGAGELLQDLSRQLAADIRDILDPLMLEDLQVLLLKLRRRVALYQAGIIASEVL